MYSMTSPLFRLRSALAALAISPLVHAQIPTPGLELWLRADKGTTIDSEGRVRTWVDQSVNGSSFAQSVVARRPILAVTSAKQYHLRFDQRHLLDGKLGVDLAKATIFALVRYRVPSSDNDYIYSIGDRGASGSQICLSRRSGNKAYHYDGSRQNVGPGEIPSNVWGVTTQVVGETSNRSHELWRDGQRLIQSSSTSDYKVKGSRFQVGGWYGGYFFGGDLRELIVYSRVVSASERKTIETWLAGRSDGATVLSMGQGCVGTGGRPTMRATSLPRLGLTYAATVSGLAPASLVTLVVLGFNDAEYARVPLPLDLTGAGLTGCVLRVSIDIIDPRIVQNGASNWSVTIPNLASLDGQSFHLQTLDLDPLANQAGLTLSNALSMTIGR